MFAAIASLLISRSQSGLTLGDRKFSLLTTGIVVALLCVPASLISNIPWLSVVFIIILTFVIFYLIGLKLIPDFPAIVVLGMVVMIMAFSHTVESGLRFGALFLLVTVFVYLVHFVILPTRPMLRLRKQLQIIISNLETHHQLILKSYSSLDDGIAAVQKNNEILRRSILDFQRLWKLFRVQIIDENSQEAGLLQRAVALKKIADYLVVIWQFRAREWPSDLFEKLIVNEPLIRRLFEGTLLWLKPGTRFFDRHELEKLIDQLAELDSLYLEKYEKSEMSASRAEWIGVFSTLHAIRSMMEEVLTLETVSTDVLPTFSIKKKLKFFFVKCSEIFTNLGFRSQAFKFGLRSTIIIGSTMAFHRFYEPEFGYWLVLFTVLLIRPNLGISIQAGRDRFIGTVAGGLLAFLFVLIFPVHGVVFYAVLFVNLFLMIWLTNLDKIVPTIITITFLVVCLFSILFPGDNSLAFVRIGYTLAMVLLVLFLTFLFWPERARKKIADVLVVGLKKEKKYFAAILSTYFLGNKTESLPAIKKEIEQHFENGNVLISAARSEVLQTKILAHGLQIKLLSNRIYNTLQSLDLAAKACNISDGFAGIQNDLIGFTHKIQTAFDVVSNAIDKRGLPDGFPDLHQDFEQLKLQFKKYKQEQSSGRMEIKTLWNNSTFIWNLQPLILELEAIRDEIILKMKG